MIGFLAYRILFKEKVKNVYSVINKLFVWTVFIEIIFVTLTYVFTRTIDISILSPRIYIQSIIFLYFVVICSLNYEKLLSLKKVKTFFEYLGKVSYSVYLLHWMVLVFITHNTYYILIFKNTNAYVEYISLLILTIIICSFISFFTYTYIEQPGLKIGIKIKNFFVK